MILSKVYEDAERRLERNEITLGEFERLVDIEVIEPKHGKWIDISEWYAPRQKCSIFETVVDGYGSNFCPNCGADMREREGE